MNNVIIIQNTWTDRKCIVTGYRFDEDSLVKSLDNYRGKEISIYNESMSHIHIDDINRDEIIGKFLFSLDKYSFVDIYDMDKFNSIENPALVLTFDAKIIDSMYLDLIPYKACKVENIAKIEICDYKELNIKLPYEYSEEEDDSYYIIKVKK